MLFGLYSSHKQDFEMCDLSFFFKKYIPRTFVIFESQEPGTGGISLFLLGNALSKWNEADALIAFPIPQCSIYHTAPNISWILYYIMADPLEVLKASIR